LREVPVKVFLLVFLLLLLAGGGVGFFFWRRAQAKTETDKPALTITAVTKGPIKSSVAATGRVVSNLDVDIKCKASGTIVKLPFDISAAVKLDDMLMELDPVDEKRNVALADASLASARARLAQSKQNLLLAEMKLHTDTERAKANLLSAQAAAERARIKADRLKGALAKQAATQEDYDAAETDAVQCRAALDTAQAQIDELKAEEAALDVKRQDVVLAEQQAAADQINLDVAKQRLKDCTVLSPMDGVVSARNVQIGQIISSAISNVGGGTTVLTVSDLSHIFSMASVDESDIGQVREGQEVSITADAYKNRKFRGVVVQIAPRGANVSNVVTYPVKIEVLDEKKALLKPEMTTNVEIIIAEKDETLTVPAEAVTRKQGQRFVQVVKPDGGTEEREVKVGISDNVNLEITSGLTADDKVSYKKGDSDSKWRATQQNRPAPSLFGGPGGGGRR
jgi:HlyD family secretion protein